MIRAAIYARKSTSQAGRDDEDKSVARQVANARTFAASKGWQVDDAHIYCDDAVSGAEVAKLRNKQRMLDLIASGTAPFAVLLMQSNDRLSRRDGAEAMTEMKTISLAGIDIWFYADSTRFEFGTFASNTLAFLKAEFAAEYRRSVSAKTTEALRRKAEQGYVTGGRVFGYDNARVNSHTERRINEQEAIVVRRIYEMYAAGNGLPTIAKALNTERAPRPHARRPREEGWVGSSVREILRRPLYRGEIVYGRAKKRDVEGVVRPHGRPESDWLRVDAPHLRVVPDGLADAVDARFDSQRTRSLRLHNGRLMGRPAGEGSPYLLTGILRCGTCGSNMEVLANNSKRTFEYRCYAARRKGVTVCANKLAAKMVDTDSAVLRELRDTLLHPAVVERALAHAEALLTNDRTGEQVEALQTELAEVERAVVRLTRAIAAGGELAPLVAALETHERRRGDVAARLESLRAPRPSFDVGGMRHTLQNYLADWRGLLSGHLHQAQQVIRRLVVGKLTLTPQVDGYYTFTGKGTVRPLLMGVVRNLASPPGFEPGFQP